jgi:Fe(3+) dicitrate transport protein
MRPPRSALLLVLAFLPAVALADDGARVSGRITDVSGGIVPGVVVDLRRLSGDLVATQVSDQQGQFAFANVAPSDYAVTASLPGFSIARREITVRSEPITVEFVLRPRTMAEDVTVVGVRLVGSEEMLRRIPGSFDLLTRDALQASHVFTTGEALRKVPGVSVRDEEGLGLRPNIGIRGLNPTRSSKVLLLEDGVPVAFATYGDNASYYHPPIERFERIEVLKGSSQIAYGPVTLGGVINYLTPLPAARPSFTISATGGNRDYLNAATSFGNTFGRTGLFVQGNRKQGDGARANVHSELSDVMGKVIRTFGATQHVTLKGTYYDEDSQVTYSGLREDEHRENPRQNPFANDHFDGNRSGASTAYQAILAGRVAFSTTGYVSRFRRHWWRQSSNSGQRPNDATDPLCGGMANLNTTCGNEGRLRRYWNGGVEARARIDWRVGVAHETDFGARVHWEDQNRRQENGATPTTRSGVLAEHNVRTTDAMSAFAQHRLLAGPWTITPGVRVEHVSYRRTNRLLDVSGETKVTEVIPGIGVAYSLSQESTVFGGIHRGFAPPRAEDVISNTTGGVVDLDPERSWNYELGGRARFGERLRVEATIFRLDYENQIVPASLAGGVGATLTNGGETLHQGVEAGAESDWNDIRGTGHGVYARLAYTWIPVAKFTGVRTSSVSGFGNVSVSGNRLPYAAEQFSAVTLGYRHVIGLDVQVEGQYLGDQFGDDLNTLTGSADGQRGLIPAHTLWNAAASWALPRTGGSIFIAVKNLADRMFIVDRSRGILPGHPRLIHVGTSWRF